MIFPSFQSRVLSWFTDCFGEQAVLDKTGRGAQFLEEAIELTQATGITREQAHFLVDYVHDKPVGEIGQEVGGVTTTLAVLCSSQGLDVLEQGETELARIITKIPQIRAKQALKPKFYNITVSKDQDNEN